MISTFWVVLKLWAMALVVHSFASWSNDSCTTFIPELPNADGGSSNSKIFGFRTVLWGWKSIAFGRLIMPVSWPHNLSHNLAVGGTTKSSMSACRPAASISSCITLSFVIPRKIFRPIEDWLSVGSWDTRAVCLQLHMFNVEISFPWTRTCPVNKSSNRSIQGRMVDMGRPEMPIRATYCLYLPWSLSPKWDEKLFPCCTAEMNVVESHFSRWTIDFFILVDEKSILIPSWISFPQALSAYRFDKANQNGCFEIRLLDRGWRAYLNETRHDVNFTWASISSRKGSGEMGNGNLGRGLPCGLQAMIALKAKPFQDGFTELVVLSTPSPLRVQKHLHPSVLPYCITNSVK